MKCCSINQKWAQERNFNKRRLSCATETLRSLWRDKSTTLSEREILYKILLQLNRINANWKANNTQSKEDWLGGLK